MRQVKRETDLRVLAARVLQRAEESRQINPTSNHGGNPCNKAVQAHDKFDASKLSGCSTVDEVLSEVIDGLPVTLSEIKASPLFDRHDFADIAHHRLQPEALRMYIASWLIAGFKRIPFVISADWLTQLCPEGGGMQERGGVYR